MVGALAGSDSATRSNRTTAHGEKACNVEEEGGKRWVSNLLYLIFQNKERL